MINSPIRFMAMSSSAFTGSPLAFLERGIDPGDRLLTPLLEPENLARPTAATKVPPAGRATQKPQAPHTSRWCASPSPPLAKSQRACRRNNGSVVNVDELKLALVYHRPINRTLFSKLSVMFRSSLDTSIKPILCPRIIGSDYRRKSVHAAAARRHNRRGGEPPTPKKSVEKRFVLPRLPQLGYRDGSNIACRRSKLFSLLRAWRPPHHPRCRHRHPQPRSLDAEEERELRADSDVPHPLGPHRRLPLLHPCVSEGHPLHH